MFDPTDKIRRHQELPCRLRGTDGEEKTKSWSSALSPAMSDCEGLPTGERLSLLCMPCPGIQEGLMRCTCAFWKLFGSVRLPCICFSSVCLFSGGRSVQQESSTGGRLTHSAAEGRLAQFGPLYGNLESVPSGSIIIMEDDTPDVLIRYGGREDQQGRGRAGPRLPVWWDQRVGWCVCVCVQQIKHFPEGSGGRSRLQNLTLSTLTSFSFHLVSSEPFHFLPSAFAASCSSVTVQFANR